MAAPIFIVSTGRCGSTMLSNMVRCHRSLLSISEFFTSLGAYTFRGGVMTGAAVARRLGTLSPAGRALLENGLHVDEFLYPLGPGARYGAGEVPPILCTTLPHLTEDHERLWDELAAALSGRGSAPLGEHYRFVFDWLAERFGRSVWLERSGASLLFVPTLARLYPDARFVHIYRDGRDTALSMRRHHFFRLRVQMAELLHRVGLDPMAPVNVPGTSPWVPAAERLRFGFFDAERYRRTEIPLPAFGRFWSEMIERGLGYLAALPEQRVLSLRYEDVVAEPEGELRRFIRFVGPDLEAESWLAEVSALPNAKAPAWQSLEAPELAALERACGPGQRLLGYLPADGA